MMEHAVAVVHATCDKRLTPSQVASFHGKIVVCLHEMFYSVSEARGMVPCRRGGVHGEPTAVGRRS
jgi:hypothetical protein